ncbi:MAG: Fic family protein [Bacillales bacterium]|jgi:prophage maintenance system killer protein|nr:Fic family protein [Bacillales bacterium]
MKTITEEQLSLIEERKIIKSAINALTFGTIEVRQKGNKQYIYLHNKIYGSTYSVYAGEFSEVLYNQILKNNIEARSLKKRLRIIEKELKVLGYSELSLSPQVQTNIDFAKRNLIDLIYKQAILEGIAVTFLDTETIIEGGKINNVSTNDIQKINNLKHAWQFILDENVISIPSDFNILSLINKLVEEGFYFNAGKVRNVPVSIGGTSWKPSIPLESLVKEELISILNNETDIYNKAINSLLYIMKRQIFIDGNKRTAVIFANHILISNGAGLIVIPENAVEEYKKILVNYYETDNNTIIFNFIYEKCLTKLIK